jgi:hypothetical protein
MRDYMTPSLADEFDGCRDCGAPDRDCICECDTCGEFGIDCVERGALYLRGERAMQALRDKYPGWSTPTAYGAVPLSDDEPPF